MRSPVWQKGRISHLLGKYLLPKVRSHEIRAFRKYRGRAIPVLFPQHSFGMHLEHHGTKMEEERCRKSIDMADSA
jgi:hypothetical protein